jgi:hypothetical protein
MQYVEEKRDVLGELLDYYTKDLLKYKPFVDEFDPAEIEELARFIDLTRSGMQVKVDWSKVQSHAKAFADRLRSRGV